jgi:diphthamide synthase (EF-2-diphthine--ammonia ligase)
MKGLFPLWNQNTEQLARKFLNLRFKAIITCIDSKALSRSFAGKEFDEQFLNDLPTGVDPCGENGEFHTFVYDGPIFNNKIDFEKGDIVLKNDRFYYCDLTPK